LWCSFLSAEVFVFEARLTHVTGRKLGVYVPKELERAISKYLGKKVVVHIYIPKYPL